MWKICFFIKDKKVFKDEFDLSDYDEELISNFNAAPTQYLPVVTGNSSNKISLIKWGLVPYWAKDISIGSKMINARAETLDEKPSFRNAIKKRRCIIPANGFYEWKIKDNSRNPYFIYPKNKKYFAFAGLYEERKGEDGSELKTFSIITTSPNEKMSQLHNRMPVILSSSMTDKWLNPKLILLEDLRGLLQPCPDDEIEMHEVSSDVNNVRNNYESLMSIIT